MPRKNPQRRRIILDLLRTTTRPPGVEEDLLTEIKAYVVGTMKLTEHDAEWFYNKLQRDHWTFQGVPVVDWRALAESFRRNYYFESQRRAKT